MLWKTKVVPIITQHAKNLAEYEQFVESHNLDDMISKIQIANLSPTQITTLEEDSKYDLRKTVFKTQFQNLTYTEQERVNASLKTMRNMDTHRRTLLTRRLPEYCGFFDSDLLCQVTEPILIQKITIEAGVLKARAERKAAYSREEIASLVNAKTTSGHVAEIYHMTPEQTNEFGGGINGGMGGTISGNQLFKIFNYLVNRGERPSNIQNDLPERFFLPRDIVMNKSVVFEDFGSGIGSALIQAMLVENVKLAVGVECEKDIANQSIFKMENQKSGQYG